MAEDELRFSIQARGWASATILPAGVKDLMWAQEQAADLLPYQLPGARRPTLGTVYVRQDIGNDLDEAPADQPPAPAYDEHGLLVDAPVAPVARAVVRPPSKSVRSALDNDDHLVITGGPGQGKSTLTLRLTADIVRAWSCTGEAPIAEPVVPLRLPARLLATHLGQSISETLATSASAEYGRYLTGPLDPALFARRVSGHRWLLLIDALDEVADTEARAAIVHTLAAWAGKDPYRVVLTTRPAEGGALSALQRAGAMRYELLPFDEEGLRRFAGCWFGDEDQTRTFLHQIRDAHLTELVAVPLLATIAAIVFERHGDRPLPGNQFQLYESYLGFISSSRSTPPAFERHRTALVEVLGRSRRRSDVSLSTAVRRWVECHPGAGTADELIDHLTAAGPFVQRGGDLAFLHHSFAEHVAATAEARELPAEFDPRDPAVAELLHAAKSWEAGRFARAVLLHYTHLHPDQADELLRRLHGGTSEQHLIAARLLCKHLPASAPVVDEFLTTVRGWAMTTQYRAANILARTSRATHHPGLADWLADLFHDEEAPWESRAEAATALAVRLRDRRANEAIAFLRAGVENASAPAEHRLIAAEALADSGSTARDAAERGLRSVLGDPYATGSDRRGAAVVLAAFGGEARDHAVAALQRTVSDVDTPVADLVEAALGLIEIGLEFHEQCAEIFLSVLRDRAHSVEGRKKAAVGLASLGDPQSASQLLEKVATDRRLLPNLRANGANALASLGPRQRVVAAELVATQCGGAPAERQSLTVHLSTLCPRDVAAEHLRRMLSDPAEQWGSVISAAGALAELGPAFHDEAAGHLRSVLAHIGRSRYLFVSALRALARLGEPHRADAIAQIRASMVDLGVDPTNRCYLASQLIQCGPEYHAEAVDELLLIARGERDPEVAFLAWQQLHSYGPAWREQAGAEMLAIARDQNLPVQLPSLGSAFSGADVTRREAAADVLTTLLHDDERTLRTRLQASQALVWLGGAFHRRAVDGVVRLLRSGAVLDTPFVARKFASSGPGIRASFAEALHEILDDNDQSRIQPALEALDILGCDVPVGVMRRYVDDQTADLDDRARVALMLTRIDRTWLPTAVDRVFGACGAMPLSTWRALVDDLAALGADVSASLWALVRDPDREYQEVTAAACLLGTPALSLLRKHAECECGSFLARSNAYLSLANELDPSARQEAVDFHLSVLRDADEQVVVRCGAAEALVELDRVHLPTMIEVLWRLAESVHLTVDERAFAAMALSRVDTPVIPRLVGLIVALARDPELGDAIAGWLARTSVLPRRLRTEVERFLLADGSVSMAHRGPRPDIWDDLPLRAEAEKAVREVISGPESWSNDRREAALALARLSVRTDHEALDLLLTQGTTTALVKAAELGAWARVHGDAAAIVHDEARPMRERRKAALLIGAISAEPSVHDFLLADRDAPWRMRIDELRYARAFGELRAIRDNPMAMPAQRWRAVEFLGDLSADDRTACAAALTAISADPAAVPALRRRAAADLASMGELGRAQAKAVLEAMVRDDGLGVNLRRLAAEDICSRWPTRREAMFKVLRELLPIARPLDLSLIHIRPR
ncbi:hypothetical protein UK23_23235 [Lentzea aerocolonigenes]|uniref:NACHT domain-containing protein n=1 Tax=Lentzea aerocolonigenes TaxID=68170 RepID=A0A0F0GYM2_LENAE|nr:NACHT domain-containing protein [Lentzea aerocolonigenes]KJK46518.1 hypothetical protein UK23_23235 [Lentzea aerocolonigenes]